MLTTRKKLFYAALITVVFFLGLELAARGVELLRSLRRGDDLVESAVRNRFHPLRYELIPGKGLSANGPVAVANRDGLRGTAAERPKQRTRVLCLGDSVTFGYAPDVNDDTTYPAILGRLLDSGRFEVINGGMPGFGSIDCLNHWVYKLSELTPDYVVILAGWNDSLHMQPLVKRPASPGPLAFLNSLAIFRLTRELVVRIQGPRPPNFAWERTHLMNAPQPTDPLSDEEFARSKRVLETLVRVCRDQGAVPLVLTYPTFTRPEWAGIDSLREDEFKVALSYLAGGELTPAGWRRFAATTNANLFDVASRLGVPLIESETINSPTQFHDLIHLTPAGNDALAKRVAPVLLKVDGERKASPVK